MACSSRSTAAAAAASTTVPNRARRRRHEPASAGTLYAALDRLAGEGQVEVDREEIVDTGLRRYYRLTPPGAQRLAAEVERMRAHATLAARRLGLRYCCA